MKEDWVEIEIKELGHIVTGNTPSKKEALNYSSRDYPFYKPTDLDAGNFVSNSFEGKLLSKAELEACKKEPDWEPAEQLLARIEQSRNERIKTSEVKKSKL